MRREAFGSRSLLPSFVEVVLASFISQFLVAGSLESHSAAEDVSLNYVVAQLAALGV